jgi:NAD(P)-dependent dehydrogenase (short-subunit alcohol dehydrogenase family)
MSSLNGKVAIVTGGASGIGAATVALLASRGAAVVIADIDKPAADSHAEDVRAAGGRVLVVETDVREEDQVERMVAATVAEFGRLDVLHNNAAALELIPDDPDVTGQDLYVWERTLRTNVTGPMLGCKHAIPAMLDSGGGSIVNTASVSGTRGELNMTAYGVSKAALIQLTREVAAQWGKAGIRCNAVAPGLVLTRNTRRDLPRDVQAMYERNSMTPYVGQPEDIARMVAFLASDESRYVTGQVMRVDGGLTHSLPIVAEFRDWVERQAVGTGPAAAH